MAEGLRALWRDEEGTSSVEYALLLAVVVIASLGAWTALRNRIVTVLGEATNALGH